MVEKPFAVVLAGPPVTMPLDKAEIVGIINKPTTSLEPFDNKELKFFLEPIFDMTLW